MKQESRTPGASEHQGPIDPGLEPLYLLSEEGYQAVINQLTNVLIGAIGSLRTTGNADEARLMATQAYEILLDYDDDVAEHVRWLGRGDDLKETTPSKESDRLRMGY